MKETASGVGWSLRRVALASVVFLAGCQGDENREACVRVFSVGAVCLGEEQGMTPEQIQVLVDQATAQCTFISSPAKRIKCPARKELSDFSEL